MTRKNSPEEEFLASLPKDVRKLVEAEIYPEKRPKKENNSILLEGLTDPLPEEIQRICKEIQDGWEDEEQHRTSVYQNPPARGVHKIHKTMQRLLEEEIGGTH